MFTDSAAFYLQKDGGFKKQELVYSINDHDKIIGTVQETQDDSKGAVNQAIKLINLFFFSNTMIETLQMELRDEDKNILGMITKKAGFYKDLCVYTEKGEYIAAVKSNVKIKSPSMTVVDANGNYLIKATGHFPATDFSVMDCRTNHHISSIKKRSLTYSTIKDNLFKHDIYHFSNYSQERDVSFILIVMGVALDIYFHQTE